MVSAKNTRTIGLATTSSGWSEWDGMFFVISRQQRRAAHRAPPALVVTSNTHNVNFAIKMNATCFNDFLLPDV